MIDIKIKQAICEAVCDKTNCNGKKCQLFACCNWHKMIQQVFFDAGWHPPFEMVKLPSEDCLAQWLCNHLDYTSRRLAQELRKLLKGE